MFCSQLNPLARIHSAFFSSVKGVYLSYWQIILSQVVTGYKGCHKMLTRVTHPMSASQLEIPGPYGYYRSFTALRQRARGAVTVLLCLVPREISSPGHSGLNPSHLFWKSNLESNLGNFFNFAWPVIRNPRCYGCS